MEDDVILGMDLTIDPVKEVLRLGNEEFKLNQRCIEAKPARLIAYQNYKHCDALEQPKARFNHMKKAVVEDDEWTTARCKMDQEEDEDIGPLLRWKEDGSERPGWSEISDESPSFKVLLKRAWESPDGKDVTMQLVVPAIRTKEVLQEMHNKGSGAHSGINKTLSSYEEILLGPWPGRRRELVQVGPFERTAGHEEGQRLRRWRTGQAAERSRNAVPQE
ncbi:hypothetical protein Zmor_026101 [Zophobas morio]|uniref:Uncharacterized protein n=1 Tax=Zophobas morio TaxID=2755281 RepID=A0AA38M4V3_9CUCU|nr:hypothetical protein Zmor_026101 [Zophobas morio]